VVLMLWATDGSCSGISVTNVSLGTRDSNTGNAPVNFDISWDHSWRSTGGGAPAPNNWDAAWVFVKFRRNGGDWYPARLNDSGHTVPAGASLDVGLADTANSFNANSNPGVGVLVYRSADGTGTFTKTGFSLVWKYTLDSVDDNDTVDIQVHAIEMVYVPDGAFFAGDNATSTGSFKQGSSDNDPWYIGGESAITTANAAGSGTGVDGTAEEYYYVTDSSSDDDATGDVFSIPANFPKGYKKFYVMKGEISQGQWAAFFNTLTADQKSARDVTDATGKNSDSTVNRNAVDWTSGDAKIKDSGTGEVFFHVAMNFLSWADVAAYLDWSGLRPMSELEFERVGRGPYGGVSGEYAWGNTTIWQAAQIIDAGLSTERVGSGSGPDVVRNCIYGNHASVQGPMRVGAAAYNDSTRINAGAAYYGAMDISGNLKERVVTVGNYTGRLFEGWSHGDGKINASGDADASTWPGTNADGAGFRGGGWKDSSSLVRLSDRSEAGLIGTARANDFGGRGARTAP